MIKNNKSSIVIAVVALISVIVLGTLSVLSPEAKFDRATTEMNNSLEPEIFEGDRMKEDVRQYLIEMTRRGVFNLTGYQIDLAVEHGLIEMYDHIVVQNPWTKETVCTIFVDKDANDENILETHQ